MPFRCTADAPHRKADRCPACALAARVAVLFTVLPQPMSDRKTRQHSACALAARVAIRFHCADSADTPSENRTASSPCPSSKNLSAVLCAVSAYGPPQNQIVPGLCLGSERHSTAILCRFSPGAWPVFSLPGIAIHQQSVIYGIFYTELRFSRAGCWSIWA